ncbi:MAG: DUF1549 domain-containing protein [Planctomycetaceae bacterium]
MTSSLSRITVLMCLACICMAIPADAAEQTSFINDVVPVLTRFGCNSGGCHGKLSGQNGFRLSLRGYAPELDHATITREALGRRINAASPDESLLVRKAANLIPHGGGQRLEPGGKAAQILTDWIAAGTPGPRTDEATLLRIEVSPSSSTLANGDLNQLAVTAIYSDGQRRDVTWLTQFASSDSGILDVAPSGLVKALRNGESVVRASFRDQVEIATVTTPYAEPVDPRLYAERNNVIDEHVFNKLAALRIEPSPLCDDATFIRRASLDAIGTLPTAAEVRDFLSDADPHKRTRLIERLFERPEFVDFWALQLGDILQNRKERDHDVRGAKGVRAMHQWLRSQVAAGTSWRDMATSVLLAKGSCDQEPAVGFYIVTVGEKDADQSEVADSVAQAFLGTRIGCARCHNHPLEKYTQDDYYHFVSFFSRVTLDRKKPEEGGTELIVGTRHLLNLQRELQNKRAELQTLQQQNGDAQKVDEAEKRIADLARQVDEARKSPVEVSQPRTGQRLAPQPLDRSRDAIPPGDDPRQTLVNWLTDPRNEQFSGAMVNRLWKHFLSVGLVEPVDDLRATNPPSNRPLWKTLNGEFVSSGYDVRHVMRLIMNSRTYQLAADSRESNYRDTQFYSHFYARRLSAEVLLDAICQSTGVPEQFTGYPLGVRAIQVPDPGVDSYFLALFGRSERTTACACERKADVTLPQLLHLQNSDELYRKMKSPEGELAKICAAQSDDNAVIDWLFLSTIGRIPRDEQRASVIELLKTGDRQEVLLDVFWALLNSKEFTFNR